MGNNFNVGDVVLYYTPEKDFKIYLGIILKIKNDSYAILNQYKCIESNIPFDNIRSINNIDDIKEEINQHYNEKIDKLNEKISKVTKEEKEQEKIDKYAALKNQILSTANNMINSNDDADFENKLKEICKLKKQLYTIELESASNIRQENGRIKAEIKSLIYERDSFIRKLEDLEWEKYFNF